MRKKLLFTEISGFKNAVRALFDFAPEDLPFSANNEDMTIEFSTEELAAHWGLRFRNLMIKFARVKSSFNRSEFREIKEDVENLEKFHSRLRGLGFNLRYIAHNEDDNIEVEKWMDSFGRGVAIEFHGSNNYMQIYYASKNSDVFSDIIDLEKYCNVK